MGFSYLYDRERLGWAWLAGIVMALAMVGTLAFLGWFMGSIFGGMGMMGFAIGAVIGTAVRLAGKPVRRKHRRIGLACALIFSGAHFGYLKVLLQMNALDPGTVMGCLMTYAGALFVANNCCIYRVSNNGAVIIGQRLAKGQEPKPLRLLNRWYFS